MITAAQTRSIKEVVAAVGVASVVFAACVALVASATLVVLIGTGATPDDAFHEASVIPESLSGRVHWQPHAADLPRDVEPSTEEAIEGTWVRAFGDLELHAQGHADVALETWFIGRALRSAEQFVPSADGATRSVALSHEITVDFYSADGQVLSLTSQTLVERTSRNESESVTETFQALLILSDGNWRIEQLVRGGQRS